MCGIAGIFNLDNESVSPVLLKKMTDAIIHRGPDGEGHFSDGPLGLGHRRLAIIDLSPAARQPMTTQDGRYAISYNGEIYNFQELRTELETLGHRFHSKSDTEVALAAYAEWGLKALDKFNGMFAFAVWDKKTKELFIARDRYGIKPLYYSFLGNVFIFASEQKAILAHPAARREIDLEGLIEYFTFQNFFSDKNLLKGIHTFPAGHWAKISSSNNTGKLNTVQYWDYNFNETEKLKDEREYVEELDRLFVQAVRRQLVSDVDLGAYLSGGIDSGAITAVASKQLAYMKSFTCGFDLNSASGLEMAYDERSKAEYMSYLFKTEHYEMVLKAGDMERCMSKLVWHLEAPRVGQSYPNYYAAQLAAKFVKVVLSGTGGDELFGGYPWRYYRAVVNDDFEHYIDKYYKFWQRLIPNSVIHKVFAPVWNGMKHVHTRDIFSDVFQHHEKKLSSPVDYVNHSLYFEAKTFLHGLFIVEDKLSMAHSLESRVPFMDNDLVDFAMKIPVSLKLGNLQKIIKFDENEPGAKTKKYFEKTNDGKLLLRKMISRHIPGNISNGVKQGFSAPDASWFKGESHIYVKKSLFSKSARIYEFMDADTVRSLINEHLEGKHNRRLLIWSLLNIEKYLELFLNS